MRRDVFAVVRLLVLPTLALGLVAALVPGRLVLAVRLYALIVCAVALGVAIDRLRRAYPRTPAIHERRRRRTAERTRPTALTRLENEVTLGVANAFDLHHRLAPRLADLTRALLASRRGLSLDAQPDAARGAVGEETWELARPDRPPPADRRARGISADALARVVASLERI
jgi:hypothetical protein